LKTKLFYLSLAVLLTAAFSLTSCGRKTPAVTDATPSPTTSHTISSPTTGATVSPTTIPSPTSPITSTSPTIKPTTTHVTNPPLKVTLDRIGVHDNGESGIRNPLGTNNGEIQVGIIVSDGQKTIKKVFPAEGHYSLKEDGIVDVGSVVFQTDEAGDYLRIMATAYENDGGLGEQVLYDALEFAVKTYIGPASSIALSLSSIDISEEIGGLFGEESDWLGTYDETWLPSANWGTGTYADVECPIGDGKIGLRLWFRVE